MVRLAVLASHEGTTLQALIDACAEQRLDAQLVAVISNNSNSGALRTILQGRQLFYDLDLATGSLACVSSR